MAYTVKNPFDITRLAVNCEEHKIEGWCVKYKTSHILGSKCTADMSCKEGSPDECQFCRYTRELSLPHIPDMVFPKNEVTLEHKSGVSLSFNALDALRRVKNGKLNLKIACADAWKESRQETGLTDKEVAPFDWTFSTDYSGTSSGEWIIAPTELRIDMERLKQKERILFYTDINLFEDELHDNGISMLSVKLRVMPSGFFILLRFFLRVDRVMVRVNDTRYYHDFTTDFLLREFTSREGQLADLHIPMSILTDPNAVAPLLPLKSSSFDKLTLPLDSSSSSTTT